MKACFALLATLIFPLSGYAFTFDHEVKDDLRQQVIGDLQFLGTVNGPVATPLHVEVFGKIDGTVYRDFLESRIKQVKVGDCGDSLSTVACVYPYFDFDSIYLTPNYVKFDMPQILRLSLLIHESRHTEDEHGGWRHAICPKPFRNASGKDVIGYFSHSPMAGEAACDSQARGSYAIQVVFLRNIEKLCTSCTDKVKMDASLFAHDLFDRIIGDEAVSEMKKDLGF